jgi:hypothetical protein
VALPATENFIPEPSVAGLLILSPVALVRRRGGGKTGVK